MITPTEKIPPSEQQRLAERQRPDRTAVMHQRWENLAFFHWRYDPREVQVTLPPGLTVDTFAGDAWVGLVPIFMRNVRPHYLPPLPYVSSFLELNLRTYVYDELGRPGIYFYSLSCNQPLVVEGARKLLHLNYEHAEMKGGAVDGRVALSSQRLGEKAVDTFVYRVSDGPSQEASVESLEFFLIERYRLFSGEGHQHASIQVHHAPYRLLPVSLFGWGERDIALAGLTPPGRTPDHACAAETVDLEVFLPETVPSLSERESGH